MKQLVSEIAHSKPMLLCLLNMNLLDCEIILQKMQHIAWLY